MTIYLLNVTENGSSQFTKIENSLRMGCKIIFTNESDDMRWICKNEPHLSLERCVLTDAHTLKYTATSQSTWRIEKVSPYSPTPKQSYGVLCFRTHTAVRLTTMDASISKCMRSLAEVCFLANLLPERSSGGNTQETPMPAYTNE